MQEVKTVLNIKLRTDCNNKDLSLKDKSTEDINNEDSNKNNFINFIFKLH